MKLAMAQQPPVIYVSTLRRRRPVWPAAITATLLLGVVAALLLSLG